MILDLNAHVKKLDTCDQVCKFEDFGSPSSPFGQLKVLLGLLKLVEACSVVFPESHPNAFGEPNLILSWPMAAHLQNINPSLLILRLDHEPWYDDNIVDSLDCYLKLEFVN